MKKITPFMLMSIFTISFIACSGTAEKPATNNTNTTNTDTAFTNTEAASKPAASTSSPAGSVDNSGKTTAVKVYLVSAGDNGTKGKPFGNFGESLVAVSRTVQPTAAPLRAALDQLLSMPEKYSADRQQLGNYWRGSDLKVKSVSITNGIATIEITGQLSIAGIADEDRITAQIEATALQFPTVKSVNVFVNGTPLKEAIR